MDSADIVVLGSGSTAFAAAVKAQSHGAKVVMIEKSALGGTCINWGCVPSKTLIHSALFHHEARLAAALGLRMEVQGVDWAPLVANRDQVVQHLRQARYLDVLRGLDGVEVVRGTARLVGPGTVSAGDRTIRAERILIATGGFPRVPPIPGLADVDYLTSRSALGLSTFPASLVIIGGGVIALELGQMFRRVGTEVTVLEHGPRILPSVEKEPAQALAAALVQEGLEVILNVEVSSVARTAGGVAVTAAVAGRQETFAAERVLVAVGTAPATAGIGLQEAGVELDERGFVKVDSRMRTSVPGIWAAGDVIGGMMIATAGAREAVVAVEDMMTSGCGCTMDYHHVPMAIFTDPEVAMVGYTEKGARRAGRRVETRYLPAAAAAKAHITGHREGGVKIVAEQGTGVILGVHLCCHRGADIINEAALAVRFGLTVDDLASSLHVYPTMAELLRLCAQEFRRDTAKLPCCAE